MKIKLPYLICKYQKKLCLVFCFILSSTINSQTIFDLTAGNVVVNEPDFVSETVDGITVTITTRNNGANNTLFLQNSIFGTNGIAAHDSSSNNSEEMIVTFSQPVDVSTITVNSTRTETRTFTFTPTGGSNTAVMQTDTFNSPTVVTLDFVDVTTITITSDFLQVNAEQMIFDRVTLASTNNPPTATAPTAPVVLEDANNVPLTDNIQVSDADGDDQTVSLTITGGTLTIGTAGITFDGSGNGSASFTAQGTLANINAALDAATFTPTTDLNGTNVGTIAFVSNDGTDDSNNASVTFNIIAVNDEPSFTPGANETVNEDAGAQTVNAWATSLNTGATNENAQTLSFTVTNDNNALFSTQPAIDANGNLTYTPANDASGTATVSVVLTDNGGTANGGDDTFATQQFTITVNSVNDEPSFTAGADETVNEDAGTQTVNAWATGLNTGATNESAQTLSFAVTNDNNTLFSVQPAVDANGNLTYTPANDANGTATVSVVLTDNGGTANGGDDTFATQTFDIIVNPVNDEPSFTAGADETVNEDAGAQTVNAWATGLNTGATNESAQTLSFAVTNDNNALFSAQPAIDANGNLTYTPANDASGTATVSVVLSDNGGTANGGDDTFATQTFDITVNPVNDEPSFTAGADETVNEDAGAQTVNAWATSLNTGATNESAQTLSFAVTNDNNTLFSAQPAIDANGNLTYTPANDASGTATVSVVLSDDGGTANGGDDTFATQQFTITVNPVNDEPSFTAGADETVNEDAGTQTVNAWATSLNTGATNESAQTLSFTVTNNNNALFSAQPAISASGNLTYTPADDASGTATVSVVLSDNGGTANGGDDTFATQQFTITVNSVNDEPSFTAGADETVNEDAGAQTVNAWATSLNTGATNESAQTLSFAVTNDNNTLFSVQPAVDASGNLTYTPADDASGTATVSVVLSDDGGTANGGDDTFATQTFDITVNPVNDEPSFTAGADETVNEDAGTQIINAWATSIDAGATNESAQILSFTVTNDNNALFSVQPAIDASGNLTYTPADDASGTATVSVVLSDNGGTANGGDDTFATQTFDITVNPVNDAPSFTLGEDQTVVENAGTQTVNAWATNITAGPSDESDQALSFSIVSNDNSALFSSQPTIDAINGNLTYTPANGIIGSATITVELIDNGGTANGGVTTSQQVQFTITVTPSLSTTEISQTSFTFINPVKEILKINGGLDIDSITLYNLSGSKVAASNGDTLNVQDIASGMYIASILTSNGKLKTIKIVKE